MEKEKTVLEVCTDSIESAIAAKKGGADRIELCSNLIIGGTTPDTKMYRIIQNEAGIPARILIRPRFGDFCYSKYEKELILEQIQAFREEGAQGVVIGALLPDGSFDLEFMEECMLIKGLDKERMVRNITFENVVVNGEKIKDLKGFITNEYIEGIKIK